MNTIADHISDLREKLRMFLQDQARQKPKNSAPLILRINYNNRLLVRDLSGEQWQVDEAYFNQYRQTYCDPLFRVVRLVGWYVDLQFKGKKCTKMEIVSTDAELYSAKEIKRITACHFTFTLINSEQDLMKFGKEIGGYLNRISKRQLCNMSQNINVQMKSLFKFISKRPKPVEKTYDYHPWRKIVKEISPIQALAPVGLQALQKIRHFINIEQLIQFTQTANLSVQSIDHLKTLIQKNYGSRAKSSRGRSL